MTSKIMLVKPSDLNLRPNGGIPIPNKSGSSPVVEQSTDKGIQTPNSNSKAYYYVVFNGKNAGIYTSWDVAKKATDGITNVRHEKYKSYLEARTSANLYNLYTGGNLLPELRLVENSDFLKPNTLAQALGKGKEKIIQSLGIIPNKSPAIPQDDGLPPLIRISDFEFLFNCARKAGEERFIDEHYFTTDNKNLSLFNFCKNANPEQVKEAFDYGLIDTIYPSKNLLEISHFPKDIKKSIKNFRTKCLPNSDKDIFIKIKSSLPVWKDQVLIKNPYYIISLGVSQGVKKYMPSKVMEENKEDFEDLAAKQHAKLIEEIFKFHDESKSFINYCDKQILIHSKSLQRINSEGIKRILSFRNLIASGVAFGVHNNFICQTTTKEVKKAGLQPTKCTRCHKEETDSTPTRNNNALFNVSDEGRWIKHYSSGQRILVVGEGDFSFSTCLAKAFGWASNLIATSLDSKDFLVKNYHNALSNILELSSRNCEVMHEIDATTIASHTYLGCIKFDRIIFNFPFAGFFKDLSRKAQLKLHRRLVSMFLKNAKEMISEDGEIHVSHKTNGFLGEWKLEGMASSHRLRLIEAVDFDQLDYPGYNTKYGFGGDKNFNCYPSKTYKFGLKW